MINILIIKTSSMGDVIHTLPAVTDAVKALTEISCDWVVEEAFAEIPKWHPNIHKVIPVAWRRFRRQPLEMLHKGELRQFLKLLREKQYDYVIDAQGLMKSAAITRLARGLRCGPDKSSARESLASLVYQKKLSIDPTLHAITRMRLIFSQALGYPFVESTPDYGLRSDSSPKPEKFSKYLLFIHGTTWKTKEWPEHYWVELAKMAEENHYEVLMPWGNQLEQTRALRIAQSAKNVTVLPKTSLTEIADILRHAVGAVSVDTGLGHLAAALNVPTVSLYGPTDPKRIGTQGLYQNHITVNFECSPCWNDRCGFRPMTDVNPACFASIPPKLVWDHLMKVIQK